MFLYNQLVIFQPITILNKVHEINFLDSFWDFSSYFRHSYTLKIYLSLVFLPYFVKYFHTARLFSLSS